MLTPLPSEVARLVLDYLKEIECAESHKTFLYECPYLLDCRQLLEKGQDYCSISGYDDRMTLTSILEEYLKLKKRCQQLAFSTPRTQNQDPIFKTPEKSNYRSIVRHTASRRSQMASYIRTGESPAKSPFRANPTIPNSSPILASRKTCAVQLNFQPSRATSQSASRGTVSNILITKSPTRSGISTREKSQVLFPEKRSSEKSVEIQEERHEEETQMGTESTLPLDEESNVKQTDINQQPSSPVIKAYESPRTASEATICLSDNDCDDNNDSVYMDILCGVASDPNRTPPRQGIFPKELCLMTPNSVQSVLECSSPIVHSSPAVHSSPHIYSSPIRSSNRFRVDNQTPKRISKSPVEHPNQNYENHNNSDMRKHNNSDMRKHNDSDIEKRNASDTENHNVSNMGNRSGNEVGNQNTTETEDHNSRSPCATDIESSDVTAVAGTSKAVAALQETSTVVLPRTVSSPPLPQSPHTPKRQGRPTPYRRAPATNSPRLILSHERSAVPSLTTPVKVFECPSFDDFMKSPKRKSIPPRRHLLSELSPAVKQTQNPEPPAVITPSEESHELWSAFQAFVSIDTVAEKLAKSINLVKNTESNETIDRVKTPVKPIEKDTDSSNSQSNDLIKGVFGQLALDPLFEDFFDGNPEETNKPITPPEAEDIFNCDNETETHNTEPNAKVPQSTTANDLEANNEQACLNTTRTESITTNTGKHGEQKADGLASEKSVSKNKDNNTSVAENSGPNSSNANEAVGGISPTKSVLLRDIRHELDICFKNASLEVVDLTVDDVANGDSLTGLTPLKDDQSTAKENFPLQVKQTTTSLGSQVFQLASIPTTADGSATMFFYPDNTNGIQTVQNNLSTFLILPPPQASGDQVAQLHSSSGETAVVSEKQIITNNPSLLPLVKSSVFQSNFVQTPIEIQNIGNNLTITPNGRLIVSPLRGKPLVPSSPSGCNARHFSILSPSKVKGMVNCNIRPTNSTLLLPKVPGQEHKQNQSGGKKKKSVLNQSRSKRSRRDSNKQKEKNIFVTSQSVSSVEMSNDKVSEKIKKPASKGTRKPASEETRKPASEGTRKPASERTRKPASEGTRKPASERTRKPASIGTRRSARKSVAQIDDVNIEEDVDNPEAIEESAIISLPASSDRSGLLKNLISSARQLVCASEKPKNAHVRVLNFSPTSKVAESKTTDSRSIIQMSPATNVTSPLIPVLTSTMPSTSVVTPGSREILTLNLVEKDKMPSSMVNTLPIRKRLSFQSSTPAKQDSLIGELVTASPSEATCSPFPRPTKSRQRKLSSSSEEQENINSFSKEIHSLEEEGDKSDVDDPTVVMSVENTPTEKRNSYGRECKLRSSSKELPSVDKSDEKEKPQPINKKRKRSSDSCARPNQPKKVARVKEIPNLPTGVKVPEKWGMSQVSSYSGAIVNMLQDKIRKSGATSKKKKSRREKERSHTNSKEKEKPKSSSKAKKKKSSKSKSKVSNGEKLKHNDNHREIDQQDDKVLSKNTKKALKNICKGGDGTNIDQELLKMKKMHKQKSNEVNRDIFRIFSTASTPVDGQNKDLTQEAVNHLEADKNDLDRDKNTELTNSDILMEEGEIKSSDDGDSDESNSELYRAIASLTAYARTGNLSQVVAESTVVPSLQSDDANAHHIETQVETQVDMTIASLDDANSSQTVNVSSHEIGTYNTNNIYAENRSRTKSSDNKLANVLSQLKKQQQDKVDDKTNCTSNDTGSIKNTSRNDGAKLLLQAVALIANGQNTSDGDRSSNSNLESNRVSAGLSIKKGKTPRKSKPSRVIINQEKDSSSDNADILTMAVDNLLDCVHSI